MPQNNLNVPGTLEQPNVNNIPMINSHAKNIVFPAAPPTSQSNSGREKDEGMKTNFTIIFLFITSVYGVFKSDTNLGRGK